MVVGSGYSCAGGEKWPDSGYILRVELVGFPHVEFVRGEREKKKKIKDDFKVWSLSHWKARDKTVA